MSLYLISEWLGVVTALIYVYLASKGSRLCFVFGLISSVLFALICLNDKLYFDTLINIYYVIMSFVGWYAWKSESGEVEVVRLKVSFFYSIVFISLILALVMGYFTDTYSDASLPYLDSTTTVLAVLATWMLVKKAVENWIIWIIADGISIVLYIIKDHYPIAMLFLIYTIISIYGYYHWRSKLKVL